MPKALVLLPPLMFAALAAMFWIGMHNGDNSLQSVFIGKPAPAIAAEALPGIALLSDADLRGGQVTIVNFWASWCPPCRAEHPTLIALTEEGIHVVGVNMMDKPADALAFLAQDGNPFAAIAADPRGKLRLDWGVTAPPETFIIKGDGTVAYKFIGPLVGDDYLQRFRPELERVLAEGD